MNYTTNLYRRNNYGKPCFWSCSSTGEFELQIRHGIVGMATTIETVRTKRKAVDEGRSRVKAKRKAGYKYLVEIKDSTTLPVEGELLAFLDKYLPYDRTNASGHLLPMLAKTYDNKDNKLFNRVPSFLGQWKINGLRCHVSFHIVNVGMFKETQVRFMSREGTEWTSLNDLAEYILANINSKVLDKLIEENIVLDGELYIPGYTVNDINSAVKNVNNPLNKRVQFWSYDLPIEDSVFHSRSDKLYSLFHNYELPHFNSKEEHLNHKNRLNILPNYNILNETDAINSRNKFIDLGFEGAMLKDPNAEYQFGKRNLSMIKFKAHDDGIFTIVDIKPEGIKRSTIPLFTCKNDINEHLFNCSINGSFEEQEYYLINKDKYIGRSLHIEYGERSGKAQVPFHIKTVLLHGEDR